MQLHFIGQKSSQFARFHKIANNYFKAALIEKCLLIIRFETLIKYVHCCETLAPKRSALGTLLSTFVIAAVIIKRKGFDKFVQGCGPPPNLSPPTHVYIHYAYVKKNSKHVPNWQKKPFCKMTKVFCALAEKHIWQIAKTLAFVKDN